MALTATHPPRFSRSPLLVELVAEVERLAAAVASADASARQALAVTRRADAVRASLALDGADPASLPDLAEAQAVAAQAVDPGAPGGDGPDAATAPRGGTWLDALRVLDDPSDTHLRALEVVGMHAADRADDLTDLLLTDPTSALAELHRRLTRGLVAPERAGATRTLDQAVHDSSVGRIMFFTTEPASIPGELALLGSWLVAAGAREHGLLTSGVLQYELLRIHPYDAANGRLARAAARLVLRARGLDPDGLAAPETMLARDRMGYHDEVARTRRRRDVTIWLERWGEAVADGLRDAARHLGVLPVEVPDRAARFVAGRGAFTIADYRADARATPEQARAELRALLDAGRVARVPGSRGLRFRVLET